MTFDALVPNWSDRGFSRHELDGKNDEWRLFSSGGEKFSSPDVLWNPTFL